MVKRALTLLTSILFALPLLMPFNIYAESIDSHIRGRNYNFEVIQTEQVNSNNIYVNSGIYHITFELDDNYIGYILPNYTIQYKNYFYGSNPPNWGNSSSSFNRRVFINGSSFSFDVPITWYSNGAFSVNGGSDPYVYDSYTVTSSDVTKTSDIDSLDQIVSILNDLYESQDQIEGLLSNQLTQLQQVVSNTSLANTYLDSISKIRQFNVSYSSFGWLVYLNSIGLTEKENQLIYYFNYPIYDIPSGTILKKVNLGTNSNQKLWLFFVTTDYLTSSNLNDYFDVSIFNVEHISLITTNKPYLIYRICLSGNYSVNQSENYNFVSKRLIQNFIPLSSGIYYDNSIDQIFQMEDELAIYCNVNNKHFNYLDIITNGTNASHSAAQSSDSANSQLQTDSNTLFQQEDGFKSDMQNAMQNVNNTFRLQDMGTKFVNSAQWVRTQYENLTNNTPFASLITFSLITGLALILLGKVYK